MSCFDRATARSHVRLASSAEVREGVTCHIRTCEACAQRVEAARAELESALAGRGAPTPEPPPPPPPPPSPSAGAADRVDLARLGRYVVLGTIGAGGMGTVFSGYDPELGRKVALKVLDALPGTQGSRGRAWLLRESQSLARIAHPNVVAIHDVGIHGQQVFMAMELVEGQTLARWLTSEVRSQDEIIRAFVAAGRGLEVAHAKGLVHRDFKAENVLVGHDGRVRVTDFGLAAPRDAAPGEALTREGTAVGTPGCMAPEQLAGARLDARSDQFSYCVALYRALWGQHPFPEGAHGDAGAEQVARSDPGARPRQPSRAGVSTPARRAILRGLAVDPAARYPSMAELLAVLSRGRVLTRGRLLLGLTALVLTAAPMVAVLRAQRAREALCMGTDQHFAGVWDAQVQARARVAFAATGLPYAHKAFESSERELDGLRSRWMAAHAENCRATLVRREQSPLAMELRGACLRRKLEEVRAVTRLFVDADAAVVERAVAMVEKHRGLRECEDADALQRGEALATDPAQRSLVEGVRGTLARALALQSAGKYEQGLELARQARTRALVLPSSGLKAEAALRLGALELLRGHPEESDTALREAVVHAERARGDRHRAEALVLLVRVNGFERREFPTAGALAAIASAVVQRVGDDLLSADFLRATGALLYSQAKYREARDVLVRAIELTVRGGGAQTPDLAAQHNSLGLVLSWLGDYEAASRALERSRALFVSTLGPEHPQSTHPLHNLAGIQLETGRFDEAAANYREVLRVAASAFGPNDAALAAPTLSLGECLAHQGQFREASATVQRALELWSQAGPPSSFDRSIALYVRGEVAALQGRWDEAERDHRASLALMLETADPRTIDVGARRDALGRVFTARGQHAQALEEHRQALEIYLQTGAPKLLVAGSLHGQAEAWLGLGRPTEASPLAERALELAAAESTDRAWLSRIRASLTRAQRLVGDRASDAGPGRGPGVGDARASENGRID